MIDTITQIIITVFGGTAFWLVMSPNRRTRRIGVVLGLINQPAWYVQGVLHEQWIMMPIYLLYTAGWIRGWLSTRAGMEERT